MAPTAGRPLCFFTFASHTAPYALGKRRADEGLLSHDACIITQLMDTGKLPLAQTGDSAATDFRLFLIKPVSPIANTLELFLGAWSLPATVTGRLCAPAFVPVRQCASACSLLFERGSAKDEYLFSS